MIKTYCVQYVFNILSCSLEHIVANHVILTMKFKVIERDLKHLQICNTYGLQDFFSIVLLDIKYEMDVVHNSGHE